MSESHSYREGWGMTATATAVRSEFLESFDNAQDAHNAAFDYQTAINANPFYRRWTVTVRIMKTATGTAYGIWIVKAL